MPRIPARKAERGSQKWLQETVNQHPDPLNIQLLQRMGAGAGNAIEWLSPLASDDYAEYSDQDFLDLLQVQLDRRALYSFWPKRGPVWDGIARTDQGHLMLVEAKAHIPEIVSPATAARPKSLALIEKSLGETKDFLGSQSTHDWASSFYQYTNRLAHLYLLRQLNRLPAWLVFVYFLGDTERKGPETRQKWEEAIKLLHSNLDLGEHKLAPYVIDAFLDVHDWA